MLLIEAINNLESVVLDSGWGRAEMFEQKFCLTTETIYNRVKANEIFNGMKKKLLSIGFNELGVVGKDSECGPTHILKITCGTKCQEKIDIMVMIQQVRNMFFLSYELTKHSTK